MHDSTREVRYRLQRAAFVEAADRQLHALAFAIFEGQRRATAGAEAAPRNQASLFPSHVFKRNDALWSTEPERFRAFNRDTERTAKVEQRAGLWTLVRCWRPHGAGLRTHKRRPKMRHERNLGAVIGRRQHAHV